MAAKPLPPEKLKQYEEILLAERASTKDILNSLSVDQKKGMREGSGDLSAYATHQADQGSDTLGLETRARLMEEQQKKLKSINEALRRIYDQTYGICEITGTYIPEERLKAVPWAKLSVEAEQREEKKKRR